MRSQNKTSPQDTPDIKDIFETFLADYRDGLVSSAHTANKMLLATRKLPHDDSEQHTKAFQAISFFCSQEKHNNRMCPYLAAANIASACAELLPADHPLRAEALTAVAKFSLEATQRDVMVVRDAVEWMVATTCDLFSQDNPQRDQLLDIFNTAVEDGELNLRPAFEALNAIDREIKTAPKRKPFGPQQPR